MSGQPADLATCGHWVPQPERCENCARFCYENGLPLESPPMTREQCEAHAWVIRDPEARRKFINGGSENES